MASCYHGDVAGNINTDNASRHYTNAGLKLPSKAASSWFWAGSWLHDLTNQSAEPQQYSKILQKRRPQATEQSSEQPVLGRQLAAQPHKSEQDLR